MIVLGIETSCDETAVALVGADKTIHSHHILSQSEHAIFGGVVPEISARGHMDHIDTLVKACFKDANLNINQIDGVAVTSGPGLIGGVMVGAMMAKGLALSADKPYLAINHLEGHALTARLTEDNLQFPYLLLLVSGGHTQILIVEDIGVYTELGTTIDDALGEAFDKTGKMLGFSYPGGPKIEIKAKTCDDHTAALKRFDLPKPLIQREGCDFSFSGLKTAVRRKIELLEAENALDDAAIADLCSAFQQTCGIVVQKRLSNAIQSYLNLCPDQITPTLVVSGGVASNLYLRACLTTLCDKNGLSFAAPPVKLCSDNAVMIAWAGIERLQRDYIDSIHTAPRPRWPLTELKESLKNA